MNDRPDGEKVNGENRNDQIENLSDEFEEMMASGDIDPEFVQQRLKQVLAPSEEAWLVHFLEVPFTISLPDSEEFTPWIGLVIEGASGEMIFIDLAEGEPGSEDIGMFAMTAMIELGRSPMAIGVIDEKIREALEGIATMFGIMLEIPEEGVDEIRQSMDEFANNLSKEELTQALSEGDDQ